MAVLKTLFEEYSKKNVYYFKKEEINSNKDFLKELIGDSLYPIVQNKLVGSVILTPNNNKVVFEEMLPSEVENLLYQIGISLEQPKEKKHELIIEFEEGHARAIIQYVGNNNSHYYTFDFLSSGHSEGGKAGYLSAIIPDSCKITWEDSFTKKDGMYLLNGNFDPSASQTNKIFMSQYNEYTRTFSSKSDYLIFKLTEEEFNKVINQAFQIEKICESEEIYYSAHSLYPYTFNCFSSLNLLISKLELKYNILTYFFDHQLNSDDYAHKYALLHTYSEDLKFYFSPITLFVNEIYNVILSEDDDSDELSTHVTDIDNYMLVNCDYLSAFKIHLDTCSYDNICVLMYFTSSPEVYSQKVNYDSENNYFYNVLQITLEINDVTTHFNQTVIYKLDEEHQIQDFWY